MCYKHKIHTNFKELSFKEFCTFFELIFQFCPQGNHTSKYVPLFYNMWSFVVVCFGLFFIFIFLIINSQIIVVYIYGVQSDVMIYEYNVVCVMFFLKVNSTHIDHISYFLDLVLNGLEFFKSFSLSQLKDIQRNMPQTQRGKICFHDGPKILWLINALLK